MVALNNIYIYIYFSSQNIINHLRISSHSAIYSSSMPPCVIQQVISSMKIMLGKDGTNEGMFIRKDIVYKENNSVTKHANFLSTMISSIGRVLDFN